MDLLRDIVRRLLGNRSNNPRRGRRIERSRGRGLGLELLEDRCVPSSPGSNTIIDNGGAGFSTSGQGWNKASGGYGGNYLFEMPGKTATANWSLGSLGVGTYDVQVTWVAANNLASNATYQIFDGKTLLGSVSVNQRVTPSGGTTVNGSPFQDLGTFTVKSGTLTVVLGGSSTGEVIADAVHVTSLSASFGGPTSVNEGTSAAQVVFSSVTGGSGSYTFSYDFNDSGKFEITNSTNVSATIPESYLDLGPSVDVVHGRVTDSKGNWTDFTVPIVVLNVPPTPSFTPPATIDASLAATFTGSATSPSTADTKAGFSYSWNFGDGTTGGGASASHSYAKPGSYMVTLTATDKEGDSGSIYKVVTVHVLPSATFSGPSSVSAGSTTAAVTFANPTGGSGTYTYSYDFNDSGKFEITGSSSATATIPASYVDDGPATLVVHGRITDSLGGYTDYTTSITVKDVAPTPTITPPSALTAGTAGTFTASATSPSTADTNAGFTYAWNFGDGTTGNGASVSHIYAKAGTYTVTLSATDDGGGTGTTTTSVTVAASSAGVSGTFSGPSSVSAGTTTATVSFTNVTGGSGGYKYSYDFNDSGTFEITNSASASVVIPESYVDAGPSTLVVHGRVTDSSGSYADYTTTITVTNVAPTPSITPPSAIDATVAAAFTGSATDPSTADTNAGFTYAWNFGDGGSGSGASASHAYTKAGTYTVTLTDTDHNGGVGTTTTSVTVAALPSATFSGPASVNEGTTTATVTFASPTGGSSGYKYSYDFNDSGTFEITGSSSATATIPESYVDDGPATLVVHGRITDSLGGYTDYTTSITVKDVAPTPTITPPSALTAGTAGTFTASATSPSTADTKAGFTYAWNFGDGSTGSGASASHTYSAAGTYTVTLTATDDAGGVGTTTTTVTVGASGAGTTASFVKADTSTRGNWQGTYSSDGYNVIGASANYPSYAVVSASGQSSWTWAASTTDPRALVNPAGGHIAACWYSSTSFTVDINLTDGQTHSVALYLLDWDNLGRSESVTISNAQTGTVLTTQNVSNFGNGEYLVFNISGNVDIQFTNLNTELNAVLGGLFFAPPVSAGAAPTATFSGPSSVSAGTTTASVTFSNPTGGSGSYTYSYDFNDSGTFEITNSTSATATIPESYVDNGPSTLVVHGRITDSSGNYTDYTTSITVNDTPPTPSITPPSAIDATQAAAFTASATDPSTADTKAGFSYSWNFGDGTNGTGASISHTYANPGTYTVTLTATDHNGVQGTTTATVAVNTFTGEDNNPTITTPFDTIPNFGQSPNIHSVGSGNWSSPNTWSLGRVPQAGDVVSIDAGTTVTYDENSTAAINTVIVQAGGSLDFATNINTELMVINLLVLQNGTLQVGTASNPVAAGVTAQIVFPNVPLNTSATTQLTIDDGTPTLTTVGSQPPGTVLDPSQYGDGLIGLGNVTMAGQPMTQTWLPLAANANAGDTTLTLAQPVSGWNVGDTVYLPDTQEPDANGDMGNPWTPYVPAEEKVKIAGISSNGLTITLATPLQYSHDGMQNDAGTWFLPDVADMTRNVMVHSQSASGTRGYTMFTDRANVDLQYVSFGGLGRETDAFPNDTTYDANGNVTNIGTNQENRNAVTFLHLIGPTTAQPDGYQYTFTGNVVFCPLSPMPYRWGINLYDSDYGLVSNNVVINWAGAGIVALVGSETGNMIANNFVSEISGTGNRADTRGNQDFAFEGSAYWFAGFNNYVDNNVASDCAYAGYTYYGNTNGAGVMAPPYQGADYSQYVNIHPMGIPILQMNGNEVYGVTPVGLTIWYLGAGNTTTISNMPASTVEGFTAWHTSCYAYYGYQTTELTLDHFTALSDPSLQAEPDTNAVGLFFSDYLTNNFTVNNADVEGFYIGYDGGTYASGTINLENSYFDNVTDVMDRTASAEATNSDSALLPARTLLLNNDTFGLLKGLPWDVGQTENAIVMAYHDGSGNGGYENWTVSDQVFVTNYNGVSGDNFQVFYTQQAANFVLPQTQGTKEIGSPVAGLTNAQAWAQYGIALAGEVAPSSATTMAGIDGLVLPD